MKRKEFIRYLTHNGCLLHREGKKHTIYINPDKKLSSAVPRHQEIDDKLARKICRDLGIEKI